MTEDQIERWYEREMNALDNDLMNGIIAQDEYNHSCKELNAELNEMYSDLRHR
jgi:hypothetical protein